MSSPVVSVCIPTYNYAKYLTQSIESVLSQSYTDYELIVVDDCSTDETDRLMIKLASRDARIRYYRNSSNLGMVANWNYCLKLASGKYIKFLFADDLLISIDALGKMVDLINRDYDVSLVASSRMIINEKSENIACWKYLDHDAVVSCPKVIKDCFVNDYNYIGEPTAVLFKKEDAVRGFDANYRQLVDLEMWFHLLEKGRLAYIREPLCAFRIHEEQQTAVNAKEQRAEFENLKLYESYIFKNYITMNPLIRAYYRYDKYYLIWKRCHKLNRLDAEDVSRWISLYGRKRFFLCLPFYKLVKPFTKIRKSLKKWISAE